ncbi:glycophorin-C [Hoplias malabaricus]|uniref:glycophorin-C n=1 Tax=Hoplias malabaricus TaxID=27720 RepID=UPI00346183B1
MAHNISSTAYEVTNASTVSGTGEVIVEDSDDGFYTAIIGAVIAVVILVFLCLIVVILRYMYRYKGTYHTNEAKGTDSAETADAALRNDPVLQDAMDESKKEYFI